MQAHSDHDSDQRAIPCMLMRGGTSRGPFFNESDLPAVTAAHDAVLFNADTELKARPEALTSRPGR